MSTWRGAYVVGFALFLQLGPDEPDVGCSPKAKRGRPFLTKAEQYHRPVMTQEVVAALEVRPGGSYIDCTTGDGGHALVILEAAPDVRLLGIDLDAQALSRASQRLQRHAKRVFLAQGNFADMETTARVHSFRPADGVLFDLGLSSLQVGTRERGFSLQQEGRLDMRFDISQKVTAYEVVNEYTEQSLAEIISRFGEEPRARQIARAVVRRRPIETTVQLAQVVASAAGRTKRGRIHPATRTFQAIRMIVNTELDNLRRGLDGAIAVLRSGGRLVAISYHSLEDRLVKTTLRLEASSCICPPGMPQCVCGHTPSIRLLSRRITKPTPAEVETNPRSRSARMRVAERI